MILTFNDEAFFNDLLQVLKEAADECILRFYYDATSSSKHAQEVDLFKAEIDAAANMISAKCQFYANSIMESYGTGNLMETDNEFLQEYKNSEFWNPNRKLNSIAGRPKGEYINIFGERVESEGSLSHLQDITQYMKDTYGIDPNRPPKRYIQNAERKLSQGVNGGYVDRTIERYISAFLENATDYFYYKE